jgi:hypothetical protein
MEVATESWCSFQYMKIHKYRHFYFPSEALFLAYVFRWMYLKRLLTFPWQQDANKAGGTSIPLFGLFTFPASACTNSITKFEKFAFPFAPRHSSSRQISPCRPLTIYLICVCGAATLQSRLILFYETCLIAVMLRYLRQGPIERPEMHSLAGESRGTAFSLGRHFPEHTFAQSSVTGVSCRSLSFSLKEEKITPWRCGRSAAAAVYMKRGNKQKGSK